MMPRPIKTTTCTVCTFALVASARRTRARRRAEQFVRRGHRRLLIGRTIPPPAVCPYHHVLVTGCRVRGGGMVPTRIDYGGPSLEVSQAWTHIEHVQIIRGQ